jgi:hypothetical protein
MPMEKETIKALCLTARDFWDPCQRALFTTVDIATTWSSAHFWQSPVSRLFAALTMNPILASTTRHLICRCKWDGNRDCPEDVREHIIFQLLPLFRNLQSISLDFPGTVPSIPDIIHTRKVFQKVFVDLLMPIVQQPGLVRVDFKSVPVGVLWYFSPSVKHMALERLLPSRGYPYESISNGQTKLQVESLYLDSGHCLSCLVRLPAHNFTHLRKLSIDMCDCRHDCNSHRRIVEFLKHFSSFSKLEVLNLVPCAHGEQVVFLLRNIT